MIEALPISSAMRQDLGRGMRDLVGKIDVHDPALHWEYDVSSTDYFPLQAYAVAVRGDGPNADEALVIGLQAHRLGGTAGSTLRLYADICLEDGTILAESPRYDISLLSATDSPARRVPPEIRKQGSGAITEYWMAEDVGSLRCWLEQQVPFMRSVLAEPASESADGR